MDELRRQVVSLAERWSRLPRGQRFAMTAVLVACVVGFSFVIGRSTSSDWQPVCGGREFVGKELAATQAIWRQQGLKNFRKVGQQLCVPQSDLSRYEVLVPKSKSAEVASGSEWEKQLARTNPFSTSEVVEQHRDNALRNELRRLIKAIPAIADADVIWARSKGKSAFSNRPKVTATVNVTPRDGHDVTPELAQSLRTAVANMVPDLNAQDVVVLDQSTGLAITDHMDAAVVQQQRRRQRERLGQQVESKIASALSNIPGLVVQITALEDHEVNHFVARPVQDFPTATTEPHTLRSASFWTHDTPQDVVTFVNPEATAHVSPMTANASEHSPQWRITVAVPANYFEAQAAQWFVENGDSIVSADAECARLQQLVASLLPPNAPASEVIVQQATSLNRRMDAPETQSAIAAFTAWPHAICLFVGVIVMTSFARTQPRNRTAQQPATHDQCSLQSAAADELAVQPTPRLAISTAANNSNGSSIEKLTPHVEEFSTAQTPINAPTAVSDSSAQSAQHHLTFTNNQAEDAIHQLLRVAPQLLSEELCHERPQAIAVLLTQFSSRLASETLAGLPTTLQIDVIRRLKSLGEVPAELVDEIARSVIRRLQTEASEHATHEPQSVNRIAHLFETPTSSKVFA